MKQKANENEIHVRHNPDWDTWAAFAKARGEGFILQPFNSKEEAVLSASRTLLALNTFGPEKYHAHIDDMPENSNEMPEYPVVDDTNYAA